MSIPLSAAAFRKGDEFSVPLCVSASDMEAFGRLSGDRNPLHVDADYARRHGFKGPVVYGALIAAAVSRLLGMHLPGTGWMWHGLKMNFRNPFYLGETAQVKGTVTYVNQDLGVMRLQIEVRRESDLLADGEAQSGMLPPPAGQAGRP